MARSAAQARAAERNLRRRPHAPNAGRGRVRRAIRMCFHFRADADGIVDGGTVVRFCQEWRYQCDGWRPSRLNRITVHRVLVKVAERVGRAGTRGRPWLWKLKTPAADGLSALQD
jgi:hypothetical protein